MGTLVQLRTAVPLTKNDAVPAVQPTATDSSTGLRAGHDGSGSTP